MDLLESLFISIQILHYVLIVEVKKIMHKVSETQKAFWLYNHENEK